MTDLADLQAGWANLMDGGHSDVAPVPSPPDFRHYRPLADAADEYVRWAQSPHERIYTGIPDLDREMRGIAPGELCVIQGYSHSGKTLVLLEILKQNRDKHIAFFEPDEPRTLTLIKLCCVAFGLDALELEKQVAAGHEEAISLLVRTAQEVFPNMAVFDEAMPIGEMEKAFNEVSSLWGRRPDFVVFDYLELLQGGGEDVPSKMNTLKAWGRRHEVPLVVLHQTSRTAGAEGKKMTISSGAFGGEQQATHIIGVRRKKFDIEGQLREIDEKIERGQGGEKAMERKDLLEWERKIHEFTVTVNLVKNKRPGGRLLDDMDFEIMRGSGQLRRLAVGDLPRQYREANKQ